jgi:hypothetical protein
LPLNFSMLSRPLAPEVAGSIQQGYLAAFTGGAGIVALSLLCVGLLKMPATHVDPNASIPSSKR